MNDVITRTPLAHGWPDTLLSLPLAQCAIGFQQDALAEPESNLSIEDQLYVPLFWLRRVRLPVPLATASNRHSVAGLHPQGYVVTRLRSPPARQLERLLEVHPQLRCREEAARTQTTQPSVNAHHTRWPFRIAVGRSASSGAIPKDC